MPTAMMAARVPATHAQPACAFTLIQYVLMTDWSAPKTFARTAPASADRKTAMTIWIAPLISAIQQAIAPTHPFAHRIATLALLTLVSREAYAPT